MQDYQILYDTKLLGERHDRECLLYVYSLPVRYRLNLILRNTAGRLYTNLIANLLANQGSGDR